MKHYPNYLVFITTFLTSFAVQSTDPLHNPPFDFLFGNHIDTHQETKLKFNMDGSMRGLKGRLYIIYTGDTDPVSGLVIARHPRGSSHNEVCGVDLECSVGWTIEALPGEAKFLFHKGANGNDHPVWLLNRVNIPQPGSYTHFHWITTTSTDPRAATVPEVCDQNNAGMLETAGAANTVCPGWFLQIHAVEDFAFQHGGEKIPVQSGIDNATHLNLLTNYAAVEEITSTRSSGGGH